MSLNEQLYPGHQFDAKWRSLVFPAGYKNPQPKPRYHLVVIGAGPAGLVTAIAAAGLGANVALIEKQAMGGDCLNVGCVPSKALLEYTAAQNNDMQFGAAFAWLRQVRASIAEHDSVDRYAESGVDVFLGPASFADASTVRVGDLSLNARRSVIATGAHASLPPVPGLVGCQPLTNETIFELREQPRRLAIIGAGPIGCELAQVFARLGTEVTIIERSDRIMPTEHTEASTIVAESLEHCCVQLYLDADIKQAARRGDAIEIDLGSKTITADELLVAAGRRTNVANLNLEAANVTVDQRGLIIVDKKLRTSNKRIFAAGDVCSRAQFTHNADAQARIVVQNALFAPTATTDKLVIPHCTYTNPEVAKVGSLGAELDSRSVRYDSYRIAFSELDRGKAQADTDGFAEVLTAKDGDRILGATIVGHDAGEQIAPICIAMNNQLGLGSFAKTILPYPTRAEYIRRLADQANRRRLTPAISQAMRAWFKWTR